MEYNHEGGRGENSDVMAAKNILQQILKYFW